MTSTLQHAATSASSTKTRSATGLDFSNARDRRHVQKHAAARRCDEAGYVSRAGVQALASISCVSKRRDRARCSLQADGEPANSGGCQNRDALEEILRQPLRASGVRSQVKLCLV